MPPPPDNVSFGGVFCYHDDMAVNRGIATFGLDHGTCPPWLFRRMKELGGQIVEIMVEEYGPDEVVKRLSEPGWFQSLGTVLAFDWNASGLTTILTAALKEAIRGREHELGLAICGGKGKTSLKTPDEITRHTATFSFPEHDAGLLVYNSRMAAKVDASLLQDGFDIYHHAFFFSRSGAWTVVQQGMNKQKRSARRYHWHSENLKDLVVEPHAGIASRIRQPALNLTARDSVETQSMSVEMVDGNVRQLMQDIALLDKHRSELSRAVRIKHGQQQFSFLDLESKVFDTHPVLAKNFRKSRYLEKILHKLSEVRPDSYEALVATEGVGPATVRALSLVAEVIYGARPSYMDPARYSFAHGGKDDIPYLVDTDTYDETIEFFRTIVPKLNIDRKEKEEIQKRLPLR